MADIGRWLAANVDKSSASTTAVMSAIEDAFASGPESVSNLVGVSFLELLPSDGEPGVGLRDLLGARCREHVARYSL